MNVEGHIKTAQTCRHKTQSQTISFHSRNFPITGLCQADLCPILRLRPRGLATAIVTEAAIVSICCRRRTSLLWGRERFLPDHCEERVSARMECNDTIAVKPVHGFLAGVVYGIIARGHEVIAGSLLLGVPRQRAADPPTRQIGEWESQNRDIGYYVS